MTAPPLEISISISPLLSPLSNYKYAQVARNLDET
jgi:hypothetical protein